MKTFLVGLFVVFLLWYAVKAIIRLLGLIITPKLAASNNGNSKKTKKGNVTIDFTDTGKKRFDKQNGEYVDFEEVK